MKAITIWQPWASLLACGAKQYETRSWATSYRGPIAIHAAAKSLNSIRPIVSNEAWNCIYDHLQRNFGVYTDADNTLDLPTGAIIATAELINCWSIVHHPGTNIDIAKHIPVGAELDVPRKHPDFGRYIVPTDEELLFGDWTPGRYAWEFANMTILPEPIPATGAQRIWNWTQVGKEGAR